MMTTPIDPRVEAYLRQLDFALSPLPWEQRNEIFTDITEHIDRELAATGGNPDAVDDVLRRVGDPHVIAVEAGAPPAPVVPAARVGRGLEIAAIVLLSAGSIFVPVLGWIVGVVLLWSSRRFSRADKLIGTLVPPLGFFAPFFLLFAPHSHGPTACVTSAVAGGSSTTCTVGASSTPVFIPIIVVAVLVGAAIYTLVRLSRRVARMA